MKVFDNKEINIKNINVKINLKYSNDFTFVGLKYNKSDLLIQTPKLYCSYGVNEKYDKNFIDLSLQNIENDKELKIFESNLKEMYEYIQIRYPKHNVVNYLKDLHFRLKVRENIKIFDTQKNVIDKILPNTYGNYIIYLQGFWIINRDIYFQWYMLQAKIYMPIYLDEYAFLDGKSKKNIPKPPPLPIFKKSNHKIIINKKETQIKEKKSTDAPSLDEIRLALSKLKCINEN